WTSRRAWTPTRADRWGSRWKRRRRWRWGFRRSASARPRRRSTSASSSSPTSDSPPTSCAEEAPQSHRGRREEEAAAPGCDPKLFSVSSVSPWGLFPANTTFALFFSPFDLVPLTSSVLHVFLNQQTYACVSL